MSADVWTVHRSATLRSERATRYLHIKLRYQLHAEHDALAAMRRRCVTNTKED